LKWRRPALDLETVSKREEPLILSIETATRAGSLSLMRGRTSLATREGDAARSHSTDLLDLIKSILEEAGCRLREVDVFAVASGPGSFTGLRIGVATAKSLASTLERRVVGVPTLEAVALAAGVGEHVCALLPAGRGELFAQSFRVDDSPPSVKALGEAAHVAPDTLLERLRRTRKIAWAGEGALVQREKIYDYARQEQIPFYEGASDKAGESNDGWRLIKPVENLASYVGLLAFNRYGLGETLGPEELRAIYVRPSDAELKENVEPRG
jgi:tRNA threonylcarbamoyladenosine biosynthesis protein TsaB